MAKVITLGLQKGGVSKSTTTGILSYLLAEDGYKVLVVDMDSQGNLSELLTDTPTNEFFGRSVYEAIIDKNPEEHILNINKQIDLLPANNYLAYLPRWLYLGQRIDFFSEQSGFEYSGGVGKNITKELDIMLEPLQDKYDFILIDTPPSLSEQTTNALMASDYVIVMFESSKFCYSAIPNFMESVEIAQIDSDHNVEILGILRTLNDKRRTDAKMFNNDIANAYPDKVFETIITRKASTGRLPFYGFEANPELNDALLQFRPFYEEFKARVGGMASVK